VCRAGSPADCKAKDEKLLPIAQSGASPLGSGATTIASARPHEEAWAEPGRHYTTFTWALLERIRGGDPSRRLTELTLGELYKLIQKDLERAGKPLPQKINANESDDLPFVHYVPRLISPPRLTVQLLYGVEEVGWARDVARALPYCRVLGTPLDWNAVSRSRGDSPLTPSEAYELVRKRWAWSEPDGVPNAWVFLELCDSLQSHGALWDRQESIQTRRAIKERLDAARKRKLPVIEMRLESSTAANTPIEHQEATADLGDQYRISILSDGSDDEYQDAYALFHQILVGQL
jgi:hypothetical protein